MCCRVAEVYNGWKSDGKQLYLNFVSKDLVNIYRFLCLFCVKEQVWGWEGLIWIDVHLSLD